MKIQKPVSYTHLDVYKRQIYKIKDVYSKIIYVKHKDREVLNSIHEKLDVNIVGNQAFKNINVQYDING